MATATARPPWPIWVPRLNFEDDGVVLDLPDTPEGGDLTVENMIGAMDNDTFVFDGGADGADGFKITDAPGDEGVDWDYADVDGDAMIGINEIMGTLPNGVDYTLIVDDETGEYTFTLLDAIPGFEAFLDTNNIKAGGPDTNFIDVGVLNSGDFVRISGFFDTDGNPATDPDPAAVNESNANVGVVNANLDAGETLEISLFNDPDPTVDGDETVEPITGISIGTKTPKSTDYLVEVISEGVVISSELITVGKNGTIEADAGGALFDTVRVTSIDGNAVKIGLGDIVIERQPPDEEHMFSVVLVDGDQDLSDPATFSVFIDGNNDGMINLPMPDPAAIAAFGAANVDDAEEFPTISDTDFLI